MDLSSGSENNVNLSVTQLVDACLHGNASAWQELVRRYAKLVHSVPVRYGLSPMEVDDVGQEVFIILAQSMHQIEDPERLPSWLLTTARRATWRLIQKQRRERPTDVIELSDDSEGTVQPSSSSEPAGKVIGTTTPTIHELLDGWHQQAALAEGLEKLDDRCSELLQLLFLDLGEPSYEEISTRLQMPTGSIGPTRNRCLRKLRSILESLGYGDILVR